MIKRVLDVGNCLADHTSIKSMIERQFAAEVCRTHGEADTVKLLQSGHYDLVLINRRLNRDAGDGVALVRRIKTDPQLSTVPVMLVTNYEQHQRQAVAAGAEWGFGKSQLSSPETRSRLSEFLEKAPEQRCA